MDTHSKEPASVTEAYDIALWLMQATSKFPKDKRYTLGTRIEDESLNILSNLVEAGFRKEKKEFLKEAGIAANRLQVLVRLCFDLKFFSIRQYGYISEKITELGNQIGGWSRHAAGGKE